MVPVNDPAFNQQTYEQQGTRVRSSTDSPEGGDLSIQNNATVYVQSQPASSGNENVNGLRYSAAPEIRYEDESYTTGRYEYLHAQHHPTSNNAHHNIHSANNEDIKIELIRGHQHTLHGKVSFTFLSFSNFSSVNEHLIEKKNIP